MDESERSKIEARFRALAAADFQTLHADLNASVNLCNALKEDFREAMVQMTERRAFLFSNIFLVRHDTELLEAV